MRGDEEWRNSRRKLKGNTVRKSGKVRDEEKVGVGFVGDANDVWLQNK